MTEEQNYEVKEEKCNCICKSKYFKKFVVVALGSFVGVFCALSLFAALHKPPMPPCPMGRCMMRPPIAYQHHYRGHHFRENFGPQKFDQKFNKRFDKKAPLPIQRNDIPKADR